MPRPLTTALTRLAAAGLRLPRPQPPGPGDRRRGARAALVFLSAGTLAVFAFLGIALENGFTTWRDPEYGMRLERVRRRADEHPGRPLVVVLGSSRVTFGLAG